jgi:hypothetical protein
VIVKRLEYSARNQTRPSGLAADPDSSGIVENRRFQPHSVDDWAPSPRRGEGFVNLNASTPLAQREAVPPRVCTQPLAERVKW